MTNQQIKTPKSFKLLKTSKNDIKIIRIIRILILVIALFIIVDAVRYEFYYSESGEETLSSNSSPDKNSHNTDDSYINENACNVLGVKLHGKLLTYFPPEDLDQNGELISDLSSSENIVNAIEDIKNNKNIKAILLEIDSYGGSVVAGEEIANALKREIRPTVALIRRSGTSAAYYAASGADKIFASKDSDIGSIGVTMSYLDKTQQNLKDGLTYIKLSSGKFKDTGNPDKALSYEERNLLMRDIDISHQLFIKAIAENRNLDIEKVRSIADGSIMLGEMAIENGLIDQTGGISEVREYLKEEIGEDVKICW